MNDSLRLKRLHYRSWHRGCKETDLILGRFADGRLSALDGPLLNLYEQFLEEEDADIWAWLTGKPAPEEYIVLLKLLQNQEAQAVD